MARQNGPTRPDEELDSASSSPSREDLDDPRLLDLEQEEESPFLRGQKRVPVRRSVARKTARRLKFVFGSLALLAVGGTVSMLAYDWASRSTRFRLASSDNFEIRGIQQVTRKQIMETMGGDIGRNVFFISLPERKRRLEEIPWIESATVARLLPDRLRIVVRERTPVAIVKMGTRPALIDAGGVIMEFPAGGTMKYSFPVITGMSPNEPLSVRAPRMKTYMQLMAELDSQGQRYSQDISEVDLSDPEDVKVTVEDGAVLVHLGDSSFLERYKVYVSHVREWRQQFQKLESVDLRYQGQVIVNPDMRAVEERTFDELQKPVEKRVKKRAARRRR